MIEIILHDICDTFPYLKYGLAAAVCTALALTVLNHSRIMDKEKRSNYVSLLGKSMFLAFYGAVLLQVTLLSREPGSRTAADLIPFSTWGTTAQSRAHEIENMIMFLPVGVFLPMLHRGLREFRTAVLVLTGLSAGIELIQFVTQRGYLQLVAASQIKTDFQSTIEVNYTIRKEAFACEENLLGQNSKKTLNNYVELYYSKEEQRKIFYECIGNQDPDYLFEPSLAKMDGMEEEAFVGVKTLCHPYNLALSESVFDSIFRHSFDRAHDIQEYGRVLTEHMPEIKKIATVLGRGEKVKELIEETAAELAFNNDPSLASGNVCYYYEKISMLPNFWAQTNNFKRLLSLFDRNLMFIRDVHDVCKKFNGLSRCKGNCKKCDAIHHPFSMLYKLGMLGIIPTSLNREGYVTQEFLDSTKVTYITGNDLLNVNNDCIYVLHPALTKSIDKLQRKKIKHFNLFVLGKGMSVPQDKLMQLVADYRNNTIKKSDFDSKYYSKQMKKD